MKQGIHVLVGLTVGCLLGASLDTATGDPSDRQFAALVARVAALEKVGSELKLPALVVRVSALEKRVGLGAQPGDAGQKPEVQALAERCSGIEQRLTTIEAGKLAAKPSVIQATGIQLVDETGRPAAYFSGSGITFNDRAILQFAMGGHIYLNGMVGDGISGPNGEFGGKTRTHIMPGTIGLYGVRGERLAWITTGDGYHPTVILQSQGRDVELQIDLRDEELSVKLNGEALAIPVPRKRPAEPSAAPVEPAEPAPEQPK